MIDQLMLDNQTKRRHDPSQNVIVNIAMLHNVGLVALLAWFIVEFVRYHQVMGNN